MTFPILPIISSPSNRKAITEFSVVGKILLPLESVSISKHFLHQFPNHVDVNVDTTSAKVEIDQIVELLNSGIKQVFIRESQVDEFILSGGLPSSRFAVKFDSSEVSDKALETDSAFVFNCELTKDQVKRYGQSGNR